MIEKHCRVLVVRFDLKFPKRIKHDGRNNQVEQFHKRLCQKFNYHGISIAYITAREQECSDNCHYHVTVLVDGNKVQSEYTIWSEAERLWVDILQDATLGLVQKCIPDPKGTPLVMPDRVGSNVETLIQTQAYHTALRCIEYTLKTASKGNAGPGNREFFTSQLKPIRGMSSQL